MEHAHTRPGPGAAQQRREKSYLGFGESLEFYGGWGTVIGIALLVLAVSVGFGFIPIPLDPMLFAIPGVIAAVGCIGAWAWGRAIQSRYPLGALKLRR